MNKNCLEAKVKARNEANRLANEIAAVAAPLIAPFVGQNILLQTGGFSAKLDKVLDAVKEKFPTVHFWFSSGRGYNLTANVRTTEFYDRPAPYTVGNASGEAVVYLAEITGLIASKAFGRETLRTDYTAEAIATARREVKEARAILQRAESNLAGFGEHDN